MCRRIISSARKARASATSSTAGTPSGFFRRRGDRDGRWFVERAANYAKERGCSAGRSERIKEFNFRSHQAYARSRRPTSSLSGRDPIRPQGALRRRGEHGEASGFRSRRGRRPTPDSRRTAATALCGDTMSRESPRDAPSHHRTGQQQSCPRLSGAACFGNAEIVLNNSTEMIVPAAVTPFRIDILPFEI